MHGRLNVKQAFIFTVYKDTFQYIIVIWTWSCGPQFERRCLVAVIHNTRNSCHVTNVYVCDLDYGAHF